MSNSANKHGIFSENKPMSNSSNEPKQQASLKEILQQGISIEKNGMVHIFIGNTSRAQLSVQTECALDIELIKAAFPLANIDYQK